MKKQSFIKGAFLLALATGLGKIFSAIFKIPLDRFFLHAEGMAIFNAAYNMYMFFFAVTGTGLPLAISRMIASCKTREEENTVLSTSSLLILGLLGISATGIFAFAPTIASLTGIPEATECFRIMAPALILCGITATLKGYFQGKMAMTAPALSQSLDSFGRLICGFTMSYILLGTDLPRIAQGATWGVPFGALLSAGVLLIAFAKSKTHLTISFSKNAAKTLILLALPITLTTSLHPIFNMIDTMAVVPTLTYSGFDAPHAAFGSLGRSAMLYNLPVSIATAVAASALPSVAENLKNRDSKKLFENASLALRLTLAVSLPCAAGFLAVPEGIFNFLFDSTLNCETLMLIAPSAVLLSAGSALCCILQGVGKTRYTLVSAVLAIISKIALTPLLVSKFGINGAAAATSTAYLVFALSLVIFLLRHTSLRFSLTDWGTKPFLCALVCYTTAVLSSHYFPIYVSIIIAAICYISTMFISHFIHIDEIKQIFAGD